MDHPGIHGFTRDAFSSCLDNMAAVFNLISPADVFVALAGGSLPDRAALISFDDGLRCQYEVALPVLEQKGIPAAFFSLGAPYSLHQAATVHKLHWLRSNLGDALVWSHIKAMDASAVDGPHLDDVDEDVAQQHYRYDDVTTARLKFYLNYVMPESFTIQIAESLFPQTGMDEGAFVESYYMSADMLRDLAGRGWLGSHGMSHRPLVGLRRSDLNEELAGSRAVLENLTGTDIRMFSYPLGNAKAVNRSVAEAAKSAGYTAGWTMERARNASLEDPLLFARMDAADQVLNQDLPARSRYFSETDR